MRQIHRTDLRSAVRKQNVLLTVWLIAPILIVVFLCYWILLSLRAGPVMSETPVGAGGGDTGGANAIGEFLAARRAATKLVLLIDDDSQNATADLPLLLGFAENEWEGTALDQNEDGEWSWRGNASLLVDGFEVLWRDETGTLHRDKGGRRLLRISSGQQREVVEAFVP